MAPVLLWLLPVKPQRLLWAAAWYLTAFLAFVRFAVFFFGGSTYQSNYVRQFSFSSLFKYFPLLFKPIFRFLTPLFDQQLFTLLPMALGIGTFVLLIFVVMRFSRKAKEPLIPARRQTAIIGLASLVAVTLTLLPEISVPALLKAMPNFDGDLTSRLEFTPGPFQAIAWVAAIGWISSFLSRPQYWFAAGISILVSCSVLDAVELQAKHGTLNTYLDLQKESDILRSAAPMIQQSPPDTVIFFAIPDDSPSPFGFGYHPYYMTCLLFGRESYAGHYSPKYGIRRRATAFPSPIDAADNYVPLKGIKDLIVLSVDDQQNVTPIEIQPSEPAELKTSGTSGPCLIPQAKALPNGDLPFLLPSLKEP
jgi:hypothetical protein